MQEDTKGLQTALSKAVVGLSKVYSQSRTVLQLRELSTLSIVLKPEDMAKPTIDKVRSREREELREAVPSADAVQQEDAHMDRLHSHHLPRSHGSTARR
jgi:hypothetical protein